MKDWCLGFIAECAYYLARFHAWRSERLIKRARRANRAGDKASLIQHWADGLAGHPFDVERAA